MCPLVHPANKLCSEVSMVTAVTPILKMNEHKSSPELRSYNYEENNIYNEDFKIMLHVCHSLIHN